MGAEQSVNAPQDSEAAGIGAGVHDEQAGDQYQDLASKANGIKHKLEELEKQAHSGTEKEVAGNESRSTITSISWSTAEKPTGAAASRPAATGLPNTTLPLNYDTKPRKAIGIGRGRKAANEAEGRVRSPAPSSGQGSARSNASSWRPFGWTRSPRSKNSTPRSENSGTPRSWRSTGRGHTDPKRVYEGLRGVALHAALDQPTRLQQVLKVDPSLANSRDGDDDDRTPLHWASARGNMRCAKVLIEHGADASLLDTNSG